jgi:hypothetical protein
MSDHDRKDTRNPASNDGTAKNDSAEALRQRKDTESRNPLPASDPVSPFIPAEAPDSGVTRDAEDRLVSYQGRSYDMRDLRSQMDPELMAGIEPAGSEQDFFNAYLIAHTEKYGERFRVH